jgi:hypothetical protein
MCDLTQRLLKMQQAFHSKQPAYQRYKDAMCAATNQLILSDLTPMMRKELEQHLVASNHILQQYPIKTFDDYQMISKQHMKQLLDYAKKIYQSLGGNQMGTPD